MRFEGGAVVVVVLLVAVALAPGAGAQEPVTATLMFDFGDGFLSWYEVTLTDNRTALNATVQAAEALGFDLEILWFNGQAFVADIDSRSPVFPYWWHLLVWNETVGEWELAPVGASDMELEDDVIGWFLSADDPDWDFVSPWPGPRPLATPDHPYPATAFRGNVRNTGTTESPAPVDPLPQWVVDLAGAEIGASAVGARGLVYQVTWNATWALDLARGAVLWQSSKARGLSTPALVEGDPVLGSRDGRVVRLEGATGQEVWNVSLVPDPGFTGIASSPTVHQGQVFVGTFNETGGPGRLVALHASNGSLAWSVAVDGSVHMSALAVADGAVYVGLMGRFQAASLTWETPYGLLSVYAENGTERWFFPTEGAVAASPAVADGAVYFTARDGYLYAVSTEGDLLWKREIGPSTSSPAVRGDLVVGASGVLGTAGRVAAFDAAGQPRWAFVPNGPVQSSLTLAGGLVLFATNVKQGTVYALWADDGTEAWSYVPQPEEHILATPVVVDGRVLVGSDRGVLVALAPATATRPSVAITSPAADDILRDATVTVTGTASDDVEVVRVEVSADRVAWVPAEGTTSWEATLILAEGTHTLTARVTDNGGNENTTSVVVRIVLSAEPFPLVYVPVIAGVATVAVLVAAVVLYARRVRRE